MDFPYFEFPYIGNRWLIALVASLHVVINHSAAIGGSLVVVLAEKRGLDTGDARWDQLAYRLAFAFFVLTTTLGALTGVGIWFSVMVSQPAGLAALLRIFFWAWAVEWLVFVAEVGMVLAYFLSWHAFRDRRTHLRLGWAYCATSFATMAIVTGILGAMLTPGQWLVDRGFWGAFFNPTYLPQLVLRMGLALALAAALAQLLGRWLAAPDLRAELDRFCSRFHLAAVPFLAVGGVWYLYVLPAQVKGLIPTALLTTRYAAWAQHAWAWQVATCLVLAAIGVWGLRRARPWPAPLVLAVFVGLVGTLGAFERVREFVRKPYIIPGYMYANGIRVADVPALNRDGVLAHARWAGEKAVAPGREKAAGRAVYELQCAACHTLEGPNGLGPKVGGLAPSAIAGFVGVQHQVHPFMPPFVGTEAEKRALAEYLASLRPPRDAAKPAAP